MANEKHFLLNAIGGYSAGSSGLAEETWQIGIRLVLVFGVIDDIGTLPNNWELVPETINRTETNWTIQGNWTVDGPGLLDWSGADYLNDNAGPAVKAWFTAANSSLASDAELRQLKLYPIGSTGRAIPAPPYSQGTPLILTYTGTKPVGGLSGSVPVSTSAVLSFRTQQVGRKGRGRIYPPVIGQNAMGTGAANHLIAAAAQTNMGGTAATLLEDLSVAGVGVGAASVRPVVVGAPWVQYATITQVLVGRVPDVQRRRRRSVSENYVATSVDYS